MPTATAPAREPRNLMALPAGKTCVDCHFYRHCRELFQCPASNTECDWAPSRFVPHLPGKAAD